MNYENATHFYVQFCHAVMQHGNALSGTEFATLLNNTRISLSCYVCYELLTDPHSCHDSTCQHYVCKDCVGGKLRLPAGRTSCSWCKDTSRFEPDQHLNLLLKSFCELCQYVLIAREFQEMLASNQSAAMRDMLEKSAARVTGEESATSVGENPARSSTAAAPRVGQVQTSLPSSTGSNQRDAGTQSDHIEGANTPSATSTGAANAGTSKKRKIVVEQNLDSESEDQSPPKGAAADAGRRQPQTTPAGGSRRVPARVCSADTTRRMRLLSYTYGKM